MSSHGPSITFLHPLSQKILERPPLTHGDFNNYCFGWTQDEKQEIKKVFNFLSEVTSKLFPNQEKLTLREKAETNQCPDFFMVDYYFLTTIRQTFLDFYTIILNSLVNVEFFEGQREEFEIIGTTPVGFFDWYIRSYPLESGKHIFWKKDETHVWVKFMGTFTVKDHKLYVTVPDESMYALARVQFFAYIYAIHYHKVGDFFPKVFLDFQREIIRINASREIYFSEDPKRELILRTWLLIKNWDFSALENKIKNLKDSGRGETFSRENLILGDNPQETMKTLDLLFTIYFVNFFLYSLVKDSPEFFVDMFYSNYGYWAPHRHIFQDLVQMDVSSYYAEFLNYSHNLKDSDKWLFKGFRGDSFFYWYHDFVYDTNPYFQDPEYYSAVRKIYSKVIAATIDSENLIFRGEHNIQYIMQRFDFDQLTASAYSWNHEHPGHPEFLKKFVKEREILLGHFAHRFRPSYWESRGVEYPEMHPYEQLKLTFLIRYQSQRTRFLAFTTDLELSQGFWEAVSEDKF